MFNASKQLFVSDLAQILSLVDVTKSNIGFDKEKADKYFVFSLGSDKVVFKKREEAGFFASINNNRSFVWDQGDRTEDEKKNTDDLLAIFI